MSGVKYKSGDRVSWRDFGLHFGSIIKVSRVTAEVQRDGASKPERVQVSKLRCETAGDVAERESAFRMEAWRQSRPAIRIAQVVVNFQRFPAVETGSVNVGARTPAEMRQAADELRLLADWFEQKPKEE